jgi:hypothetical protein
VEADDLGDAGLLPRWNPREKSDLRVRIDLVIDLQTRLAEQWHKGGARLDGKPLLALAANSTRPFRTIAASVELILSRTVALAGWSEPFTWGALRVDSAALALIDGRISPPPLYMTPRIRDGRRRRTNRATSRQPPAASCAGRSEERNAGADSSDCGAERPIRRRNASLRSRSGNRAGPYEHRLADMSYTQSRWCPRSFIVGYKGLRDARKSLFSLLLKVSNCALLER